MITIDVERRAYFRTHLVSPSFRRNDNDRRPARPVIRPNDGPGDLQARRALAAKQLAIVERKRPGGAVEGQSYTQRREAAFKADLRAVLTALDEATIELNILDIARLTELGSDRVSVIVARLDLAGLVLKETSGTRGGRSVALWITDAGREHLAEVEQ